MNTPNPDATPPPRRVLVLESDQLIRTLILEWLAMAGKEAVGAMELADAAAPTAGYEIVLADVPAPHRAARLAVMDLKRALPGTPVIAMSADITASGDVARDTLARELGASAVLVKPFDQRTLLSAIHRVRA